MKAFRRYTAWVMSEGPRRRFCGERAGPHALTGHELDDRQGGEGKRDRDGQKPAARPELSPGERHPSANCPT